LVSAFFFLFPAIGVSVVALGLGTGAIGLAVSRRRRRKTAQRAWVSQQQWRRRTAEIPSLAKLYEQAADLRRRLADTELPLHMHADLRQSVREIERAGSALAERVRTADSALERLDPPQLRIRLAAATAMAAHDPKAAMERDQLARALADLDEVVARRSQAITDLERLQGSLSEVALFLTRTAAHDEPELDAVHRKVQALQQAIRVRD